MVYTVVRGDAVVTGLLSLCLLREICMMEICMMEICMHGFLTDSAAVFCYMIDKSIHKSINHSIDRSIDHSEESYFFKLRQSRHQQIIACDCAVIKKRVHILMTLFHSCENFRDASGQKTAAAGVIMERQVILRHSSHTRNRGETQQQYIQ